MAEQRTTFELTDEQTLRTMSHPLRIRLLAMLRADGPATASRLADRLAESSGATSYHLRRLAKVGLIVEDPDRGTRRERWWRAAHQTTTYSPATFLGDPETHRAHVGWRREWYRWQWRLLDQWLAEEDEWDPAWVAAAGGDDDLLTMSPESAREMAEEIYAVVQRYRSREDRPDQADHDQADQDVRVVWFQHLVPIRGELPL